MQEIPYKRNNDIHVFNIPTFDKPVESNLHSTRLLLRLVVTPEEGAIIIQKRSRLQRHCLHPSKTFLVNGSEPD